MTSDYTTMTSLKLFRKLSSTQKNTNAGADFASCKEMQVCINTTMPWLGATDSSQPMYL